jgi:hypothetical protein
VNQPPDPRWLSKEMRDRRYRPYQFRDGNGVLLDHAEVADERLAAADERIAALEAELKSAKETIEVLSNNETAKAIAASLEDVKAGRVRPLARRE